MNKSNLEKIETEKQEDFEKLFESYYKETENSRDDIGTRPLAIHFVEKQKIMLWVRLYLVEEYKDLLPGDIVTIEYIPNNEKIVMTFVCYAKTGSNKDNEGEFINHYNPEDDNRVICLMIDSSELNNSADIIRGMFKNTIWYRYQLIKRNELIFTHQNIRTKKSI